MFYLYAGRKGNLNSDELVKAVLAIGIPATKEEVLLLCSTLLRISLNCNFDISRSASGNSTNLKTFLDLAAKLAHMHGDREEDDAIYDAFR